MSKNWTRVQVLIILGLATLCIVSCNAAKNKTALFQDGFVGGTLKNWTLQPSINALGPIAVNGIWKVEPGALVAEGTAAPWTIQTTGDTGWTDYRFSTKVTIRKPGPTPDFPILNCEYDRYLPREWFPPLCEHTGQHRFRYYAGEFDWGSDAAVWVRYQNRENCYRVQLSTIYQEIILWHSLGGYLAVVPCKLEPGKSYQLDVLAQGSHFQVLLNGKKKIDYWHDCLPTLSGKIGVGVYQATATFADVKVTALPSVTSVPLHKARFSTRIWRTQRWVFDGDEPIVLWQKNRLSDPPGYCSGMLYYFFVKLRPGYRPLYFCWVGVRPDQPNDAGNELVGTVNDIQTSGEHTDRLVARFVTATPTKSIKVDNTDTLTYDTVRGTYRHDMLAECSFLMDLKMPALEICDPLTFNNKEPGESNKYRWLPAGHEWDVFTNEDGRICRLPISEQTNLEGQGRADTPRGFGYRMLYPDRAVCPVWEYLMPGEKMMLGTCHWGYDWHQSICWQDKPKTFKTGDKFTVHYAMAGYSPAEGEKIFRDSVLFPRAQNPEPPGTRYGFLRVPSLWAFPVVEPAGTSFDKLYDTCVPYNGWQWYGDYDNDRQVGRTDHYSMRLDGPASVNGTFYHNMIDGNAKRYLCTFWLKTRDVKGAAPVAILEYPWNEKVPKDILDTGLVGDNDWTEFSFITTVPVITSQTYDASQFDLLCKGSGTVWLDDWSVRPLEDNEQPVEKRGVMAQVTPQPVSTDYLMDLSCNEGVGSSLYDASRHNNNVKLHDVTWINAGNRPVLHFDGTRSCAFVPTPSPELQPSSNAEYKQSGLTLDAWVQPTAGKSGGAILGFLSSPLLMLSPVGKDQFKVSFLVTPAKKPGATLVSKGSIPTGQWSHITGTLTPDGTLRIHINGKLDIEMRLESNTISFTAWAPMISIGTHGKCYGNYYAGDLAGLHWWNRAATDAEIATLATSGP